MIEARFDDLVAGAERAFRLVEPVGVIEARRPSEVAGAIDAAESSASRGLWAAGFVAYEAAPGLDPELSVHVRAPDDPFAELPLAWFALFERKEDLPPLEPGRLDPSGSTGSPWRPSVDRATYDATVERIRELIAAGHTYQVNHTIRLRAMIQGDERGFYRDLCLAQRGGYAAFLDLGRYRVLSASPRAVLPGRRRPHHDAPDEGHRSARPLAGRGRGDRGPPRGLVEGPRRERDDRGPAPQRPGPDLPDGFGRGGTDARTRALRDRVAAHLDDRGRPASRDHAARHVPRPVPERIGHRRAQGAHHEDHRGPRGLGPRPVLRRDRLPRAAGVRRAARELQRRDPNGGPGRPDPHGRVRRRRRHHPRLVGGRASTRRSWRRRAS